MNKTALLILRLGLGVTFLWIGVLIWMHPAVWGAFLMPWASQLLPVPIEQAMLGTALLDIVIGALLLINTFTWLASAVGALHLVIVLVTSGITDVTSRDIGLLGAAVALALQTWPEKYKFWR